MSESDKLTSLRGLSKEEKDEWIGMIGKLGMFDAIMSDGRIAWCKFGCKDDADCPLGTVCDKASGCCVIKDIKKENEVEAMGILTRKRTLSNEEKDKWIKMIGKLGMFDTITSDFRIAKCDGPLCKKDTDCLEGSKCRTVGRKKCCVIQ